MKHFSPLACRFSSRESVLMLRAAASVAVFSVIMMVCGACFSVRHHSARPVMPAVAQHKAVMPLAFIENRGQLADQFGRPMPEVLFTAQARGLQFYFTKQ